MSDTPQTSDAGLPDEVPVIGTAMIGTEIPKADRKTVKKEQRRELFRTPSFLIGNFITWFWIISAIFPELFARYPELDPVRDSEGSIVLRSAPGAIAWFGTDGTGRDVYSRVIYGADNVLTIAPVAALLSVIAGSVLGLLMGYYKGWLDEILGRIIEAVLSLPVILLALLVLVTFGQSKAAIVFTIAGLFTPVVTRTIRSAVLSEAQLDYVTSAKLRGEPGIFIMMREILPNIIGVQVVEFTVRVGYAIFTVATLAFLGLSANDLTAADWGVDIADARSLMVAGQWWPSIFPALAIASLVIGVNLIADAIDKVYKA